MSDMHEQKNDGKRKAVKTVALTAATLVLLGGVAGCAESKATPMDDQYAGNSGETEKSQEEQSQSGSDSSSDGNSDSGSGDSGSSSSDAKDTGNYKDGTYSINGQYGPVGEDSIDVHFTIKDQNVQTVEVIGHPFTSISKKHQTDFANAINGVVDGKPLKGLKVDKVAGASWTSDAFNKALDLCRQQASIQ
ncbi:FMN-binding protein [Bifidobacterium stellenboschense]|uniref:FMN-binding domain protein n=1 Tax=Bifidobacterium stellenboschense TaxID=762211 RepID=A0A087DIB8_9BIFI|nr:FMN-binding protein [Bifidobacterium stellenboschense]KFI95268.1 FMN-binding domain protein [Bifidobacterium stellenboschense]